MSNNTDLMEATVELIRQTLNEDSIFANIYVFMPFKEVGEHVKKNAKNSSGEMIMYEDRPDFEEFTEAVNSKQD